MSHHLPGLGDPTALLSGTLRLLCRPGRALFEDDTVEGLETVSNACVVTCADGHTTAGDRDHNDVRFQSRTAEHITGGFRLFRPVEVV